MMQKRVLLLFDNEKDFFSPKQADLRNITPSHMEVVKLKGVSARFAYAPQADTFSSPRSSTKQLDPDWTRPNSDCSCFLSLFL
jgi:hypothetical protein